MDHSPASLEALLSQSSSGMRASKERPTSCCCGNLQKCPYLKHNIAALDGLESQLENAARIGQVSGCFWKYLIDPSKIPMKQSFMRLAAFQDLIIYYSLPIYQRCAIKWDH